MASEKKDMDSIIYRLRKEANARHRERSSAIDAYKNGYIHGAEEFYREVRRSHKYIDGDILIQYMEELATKFSGGNIQTAAADCEYIINLIIELQGGGQ